MGGTEQERRGGRKEAEYVENKHKDLRGRVGKELVVKEIDMRREDGTEAGCCKGPDEGAVCRLEVEVRVSRMQGDQRDESRGWKEKELELLRSPRGVIGRMTVEEGERTGMKGS